MVAAEGRHGRSKNCGFFFLVHDCRVVLKNILTWLQNQHTVFPKISTVCLIRHPTVETLCLLADALSTSQYTCRYMNSFSGNRCSGGQHCRFGMLYIQKCKALAAPKPEGTSGGVPPASPYGSMKIHGDVGDCVGDSPLGLGCKLRLFPALMDLLGVKEWD